MKANELIRANRIGPIVQAQTGVHRNDVRGQWRYYRLTPRMSATTVDWDLFLGHQFEVNGEPLGPNAKAVPFDRAVFAQWRCYAPFSGGVFSDLLTHKATQLLAATGLRYPRRVAGLGGLYWEHDGRDVPDVGTLVADFDEGVQFVFTATTVSAYPVEEIIRGRLGAIKFVKGACTSCGTIQRARRPCPAGWRKPLSQPRRLPAILRATRLRRCGSISSAASAIATEARCARRNSAPRP